MSASVSLVLVLASGKEGQQVVAAFLLDLFGPVGIVLRQLHAHDRKQKQNNLSKGGTLEKEGPGERHCSPGQSGAIFEKQANVLAKDGPPKKLSSIGASASQGLFIKLILYNVGGAELFHGARGRKLGGALEQRI
jgi:hypothetical protein